MTRYELYRHTAGILAPNDKDAFFNYIIHAMDDNGGFLRSRYCYSDRILPDKECGSESSIVLAAFCNPFDPRNSFEYYEYENERPTFTVLKMQLFYLGLSGEKSLSSKIRWSAAVGFPYPIKIDLANSNYKILPPYSVIQ